MNAYFVSVRSTPLAYSAWLRWGGLVLGACLSLAYLSPVLAQTEEEPDTLILSDTLHYDDLKRESHFDGNVTMTRGNLILYSDHLVMREDEAGHQYGTATVSHSPRVRLRQESPEKFELIHAEGLQADYDNKSNDLIITGQAIVTRYVCGEPFDTIHGEKVIYHQDTETYEAFGGPQSSAANQRVRSVARPRAKVDAARAACQQKAAKK